MITITDQKSPLLQLPQNLRERIWSHAYGSLVLHAEPACVDQKMKPSGHYAFKYCLCQQPEQVTNSSTKMTECCANARRAGTRTPFFWPIVSKQFWTEAMDTLYASATFKVDSSIDLYILSSSQQHSVRRMRFLVVQLGLGIKHHNRIWSPARCSNVIKKFESLQGLMLLIGRGVEDDENYSGTRMTWKYDSNGKPNGTVSHGSRMEGPSWNEERNWLPMFLRAFQQHHLQPEVTHIHLFEGNKQKWCEPPPYHPKDRRWREDPYLERREDEVFQEKLRKDLAASMRAVLLGQDIGLLFPDWKAENERLLQEHMPKTKESLPED
ncbi:uncharacterized protein M421DRAFT_175466 [Didymella exigua CBS 183.55]|uniref:DUF7730 domain-containing protein n=1 Tax=Didymella exigua CBS 183.55 TaxID=1150837 RepID=A0A6A5RN69_9PLEO|nr:uncharacterized protein M421DRAFT_175466 [Didymella exigua CBS 183.55]KAF1927786.1 hypothetical protein M421DRAFT_175466 [Didymella exigua CBS 183.55]